MPKVTHILPLSPLHNLLVAPSPASTFSRPANRRVETRRKSIGAELIRRGISEISGKHFHASAIAETMVTTSTSRQRWERRGSVAS
jgi:hypothetical protein